MLNKFPADQHSLLSTISSKFEAGRGTPTALLFQGASGVMIRE